MFVRNGAQCQRTSLRRAKSCPQGSCSTGGFSAQRTVILASATTLCPWSSLGRADAIRDIPPGQPCHQLEALGAARKVANNIVYKGHHLHDR
jgi:hypothetical protein